MNVTIDPVIAARVRKAWARLTVAQQQAIEPVLTSANNYAVSVAVNKVVPAVTPVIAHEMFLAKSALTGDQDNVLSNLDSLAFAPSVLPDGTIQGIGRYEHFDPDWLESGAEWLEHLAEDNHPFNETPAPPIIVPDDVRIAIAGDWGTGDWGTSSNPAASTNVRLKMSGLKPHLTIHLGDVYYSGTEEQEEHNLVDLWPSGSIGALTLNSNHEMYSGAASYFDVALGSSKFSLQQGCSFFAIENANWVIVGLDTAYYSNSRNLYMNGSLGPAGSAQLKFLEVQAGKGKKVIVLTHHNGLVLEGTNPDNNGDENNLWKQVTGSFPKGGPDLWYWGHIHAGAVYKPYPNTNILCRCCGHGALPWGQSSLLKGSSQTLWFENRLANDTDNAQRVLNGFALLHLNGPDIQETFYDEDGRVAWPPP